MIIAQCHGNGFGVQYYRELLLAGVEQHANLQDNRSGSQLAT